MTKIKVGDKVRVIRIVEGFEEDGYEIGDILEVAYVSEEPRDFKPEEGAVIITDEYELYESEVEKVEEPRVEIHVDAEKFAELAQDGDMSRSSMTIQAKLADASWQFPPQGLTVTTDDSVNHPSHYTQGGIEVIDIIAQTVSGYEDGFTAHCVGTATKYLNRAPHKHETPIEDIKKARKYLEFAIAHEEKKQG